MGGEKAVEVAHAAALNSKSIGMYHGKVQRNVRKHGFIHLKISGCTYFPRFGCTPSFSMKAVQSFLHEAPALYALYVNIIFYYGRMKTVV